MARNFLKLIIALLAIAALAGILTRCAGKKQGKAEAAQEPDWIEFPPTRAHVYFATPEECVEALKTITGDIPDCAIALAPDNTLSVSASNIGASLKVYCQQLGESHTRVVIAPASKSDSASGDFITQLQREMDKLLTGG